MSFMDKNHLVPTGFYFTGWGDVVCCALFGVGVATGKRGILVSKLIQMEVSMEENDLSTV